MVTFSEPKAGNAPGEWQDGAAGGVVGDGSGTGRFIVVDGATQAYDPLRWVDQLVTSFGIGRPRPRARRDAGLVRGHAGSVGRGRAGL